MKLGKVIFDKEYLFDKPYTDLMLELIGNNIQNNACTEVDNYMIYIGFNDFFDDISINDSIPEYRMSFIDDWHTVEFKKRLPLN